MARTSDPLSTPVDFRRSIDEAMRVRVPGCERRGFGVVERGDERSQEFGLGGAARLEGGAQIGPQAGFHGASGIFYHVDCSLLLFIVSYNI